MKKCVITSLILQLHIQYMNRGCRIWAWNSSFSLISNWIVVFFYSNVFVCSSLCFRLKIATVQHPQLEEDLSYHHCPFTWNSSMELDFVQRRGFKKNNDDHSSDYPAAAASIQSCFSEKIFEKKRIKSDYSCYFLISTFPLDIMWTLQCWLYGDGKQAEADDGDGKHVWKKEKEMYVRSKGWCLRRHLLNVVAVPTAHFDDFCQVKFCLFDMMRFGQVCLKRCFQFEGTDAGKGKLEKKERQAAPEKSCSIVDKHALT